MKTRFSPSLVTLEGEEIDTYEYAELLGIDDEDAELLGACGPYLTGEDIAYLNAKYPEYMGIWPIIAKIGAGVAKVGVGIGKKIAGAVKKRRKEKEASGKSRLAETVKSLQAQQQAAIMQKQTAAADQKKKLIMIGLPVAAAALLLFMMMNKPAAAPAAPAPEKGGKK